jgi:hypothetical protein
VPLADRLGSLPHDHTPRLSPLNWCAGWLLVIPMVIQAILVDPSGAVWTDEVSKWNRLIIARSQVRGLPAPRKRPGQRPGVVALLVRHSLVILLVLEGMTKQDGGP